MKDVPELSETIRVMAGRTIVSSDSTATDCPSANTFLRIQYMYCRDS
ncbi:MAG: hypothetical protein M3297_08605 [Thermoproteota archaeon]|nr:hypothetical protein [Thermoproteota archaeon]